MTLEEFKEWQATPTGPRKNPRPINPYHKGHGDFEEALQQMIRNVAAEKPHQEILDEWDYMRGTDWFTGTRHRGKAAA